MKLKKPVREWRKMTNKQRKEFLADVEESGRTYKNLSLALKYAKKALKHIKKDAEAECGFWGESYCGCWRETCLALGRCTDNPADCPLDIAKSLVKALTLSTN